MKNILILVGTRPNFIKVTQFLRVSKAYNAMTVKIVHTGQHYDKNMADVFFTQFGLEPDYFLNISPASPASQMGEIMIKLEKLIKESFKPDILIVPGDVNSTLAGALVANKMNIPLAHLESGLRSEDRSMPEEINRILTDEITDYYFITEQSGIENLKNEKRFGQSVFVGNTMIDTLVAFENDIDSSHILSEHALSDEDYILMTIHRPGNVDSKEGIEKLIKLIESLSRYKIVFPIHPRTVNRIKEYGLESKFENLKNLIKTGPMGYFQFQKLVKHSKLVLTDSGGIQEETTFRQVPCLTLRPNTERPSTCEIGTNTLVPFDVDMIEKFISEIENGSYKKGVIPELWDGKATERIVEYISKLS